MRRHEFEQKKILEEKTDDTKGDLLSEIKTLTKDSEVQTLDEGKIITNSSGSELIQFKTKGVNTEEVKIDTLEEKLKIDDNGAIRPGENEILVEMKLSHGIKNWDEIEILISDNLKLTLFGTPWIANL